MRQLPERKSIRLRGWDYASNASYFITICTKNREQYFGEIQNGIMHLSRLGKIAQTCWQEIPQHFEYTHLGSYIVMPDHMHGIVTIDKPDDMVGMCEIDDGGNHCRDVACNIPTMTSKTTINDHMSSISPKIGSLSTIIRSYKSAVTKRAHQKNSDFAWQSRFYDHVIRNPESVDWIQQYIQNNVKNWSQASRFYPPS